MKTSIRLSILFILILSMNLFGQESCYQFPTFADPPGPENVLVIYKEGDLTSIEIKDYYMEKRSIPIGTHEKGITLPTNPSGITYENDGEIIKGEGLTAWNFVKDEIADEIENKLNTTYYNGELLRDLIRYIVLCKGIPLKIQPTNAIEEDFNRDFVSVDAFLCLINQDPPKHFIQLYGTSISAVIPTSPYYNADETFSLDYRFLPNHFINGDGWKLNYLVTRLDGNSQEEVELMIYNAFDADLTGEKTWILDEDPTTPGHISYTNTRFNQISGFNIYYDNTEDWITSNPAGEVIGYVSNGVHACKEPNKQNCMPSTYIIDNTINFDYSPGAVFNSVESFNATSFFQIHRSGQGLVTDFIQKEGTGGTGNVFEPGASNICQSAYAFPSYAIGYSLADAIYQGIPQIGFRQIAAGDPLTLIFDATPIELPNNYTFSAGNYDGHYYVPEGNTVYFGNDGLISFIRYASLEIEGNLIIQSGADVEFFSYSSLSINDAVFNSNSNLFFTHTSRLIVRGTLELEENFELIMTYSSILTISNEAEFDFNTNSKVILQSSSCLLADILEIKPGSYYRFENSSSLNANSLIIHNNSNLIFLFDQECNVRDNLTILENAEVTFGPLNCGRLYLNQGTILSYNDINSFTRVKSAIIVAGVNENPVFINMPENYAMLFTGIDTVNMKYCEWDGGQLAIRPGIEDELKELLIENCNFINWSSPLLIWNRLATKIVAKLYNNSFNHFSGMGVNAMSIDSLIIIDTDFIDIQDIAVYSYLNGTTHISNCTFNSGFKGVQVGIRADEESSSYEDPSFTLTGSTFSNIDIGVDVAMNKLESTIITGNNLSVNDVGISVVEFQTENDDLTIIDNEVRNANTAISITERNEALITKNTLVDNTVGVYISKVSNPFIINNAISAENVSIPGSGIVLVSSNGLIRENSISGHSNGIELGNSSPDIGGNTITDNLYHGIYVGSGSLPNMIGELAGSPPLYYPIAGYNDIFDNGGWDDPQGPNDNDGSEIYLVNSNVLMRRGCNSIVDDRIPGGDLINTQLLMNSLGDGLPIEVRVEYNFWGNHPVYPLSTRFGSLVAYYNPSYGEPCSLPEGSSGGGSELLMISSNGEIVDTVYSVDRELGDLSTTELLYAVAEEKFLTADYENAGEVYNQIINSNDTLFAKLKAYQRLYNLGRLTNKGPAYFGDLKTVYSSLSQSANDSFLQKIFNQLASLSLVGQTEYVSAIEEFDAVVQQNQGTEEAMYAEIDALTTALLLAPDSSLGKGRLGKYAVTDISDYTNRVRNLLKQRVGSSHYYKEPIPTEYALYQNYPNPFNPSTTIKYSIVKAGKVKLAVYDILGREVIVLADEVKELGFYEVNFDASYLSSGVYFYRLVTEDYVNTKKMLLLK